MGALNMKQIWFSIDNIFGIKVSDSADDNDIREACYGRLQEILDDIDTGGYSLYDIELSIEEE